MTAPTTLHAPDGEPCGGCGTPLAADQRYCMACGARRTAARLPFLDILREDPGRGGAPRAGSGAAGPAAVPVVLDGTLLDRARHNSGLIAGVGVLLLAMLIGVLVGSGFARDDGSVATAADQKPLVVSVGGSAATPATTTDASALAGPDPASATSKKAKRHKAAKTAAAKSPIKVKVASSSKLKGLDKLSGKAYQKQIDKLGKNIAVGGKAPPKDDKPAAGGGSFQEIG